MQAFAKYLAIAMAYDDVIRVADLRRVRDSSTGCAQGAGRR